MQTVALFHIVRLHSDVTTMCLFATGMNLVAGLAHPFPRAPMGCTKTEQESLHGTLSHCNVQTENSSFPSNIVLKALSNWGQLSVSSINDLPAFKVKKRGRKGKLEDQWRNRMAK